MKYVIAILLGLAATFAIGLLLFPIVSAVVDRFFYLNFNPPADTWKNDVIMISTLATYLLLSTATGGFICMLFNRSRPALTLFVLIVAAVLLIVLFVDDNLFEIKSIPWFCLFVSGFIIGSWIGNRYKTKKAAKKQAA